MCFLQNIINTIGLIVKCLLIYYIEMKEVLTGE